MVFLMFQDKIGCVCVYIHDLIMINNGHYNNVSALAWHPIHEGLFASGGGDGSLYYWSVDSESEMGCIEHAHDQSIWSLQWHPLGHALASGILVFTYIIITIAFSLASNEASFNNLPGIIIAR